MARAAAFFRAVVAALVLLPAHGYDRHVDLPYEETIATRLSFKENDSSFPVSACLAAARGGGCFYFYC